VAKANKYHKHKTIRLLRPTTEMSGMYRCKVSSLVDEDFMTRKMIVYGKHFHDFDSSAFNSYPEPPSRVALIYSKPAENVLNVTCSVQHVFPAPRIDINIDPPG